MIFIFRQVLSDIRYAQGCKARRGSSKVIFLIYKGAKPNPEDIGLRHAINNKAPVKVQVLLTLEGGGVKEQEA